MHILPINYTELFSKNQPSKHGNTMLFDLSLTIATFSETASMLKGCRKNAFVFNVPKLPTVVTLQDITSPQHECEIRQ